MLVNEKFGLYCKSLGGELWLPFPKLKFLHFVGLGWWYNTVSPLDTEVFQLDVRIVNATKKKTKSPNQNQEKSPQNALSKWVFKMFNKTCLVKTLFKVMSLAWHHGVSFNGSYKSKKASQISPPVLQMQGTLLSNINRDSLYIKQIKWQTLPKQNAPLHTPFSLRERIKE